MAYAVNRAFWGALKTEENKVGRARQMAIAKQQLYRRLYKSAREQYAPQIELEKRRAKAEFEKKLKKGTSKNWLFGEHYPYHGKNSKKYSPLN